MLTVVGDTHGRNGHRLEGAVLEAVRRADLVVHTGDFLTTTVLDAFEAESQSFIGVSGNNDSTEVRARLPDVSEFTAEGLRFVVVHGHEHSNTSLGLLGRGHEADVVVFGHSHSPTIVDTGRVVLLNPGSHAVPRQFRPGYAVVERSGGTVRARLCDPAGEAFESVDIPIDTSE